MNENTSIALFEFANSVEKLTVAVTLQIGVKTAAEILTACNELKRAINTDETIVSLN
jgi:hypothetical protein